MKNYDLIWAREWAGLTQAQAAEKMGVHRVTFTQWETGARPIPARKWNKFQKLVEIKPQDIPKRLQYDELGYPLGFIPAFYGQDYRRVKDECDRDFDAEDKALEKMEGDEYPARARERYRLGSAVPIEEEEHYMAEYDEEQRRVAVGLPHRSFEEIHPPSEKSRAAKDRNMLEWKLNPEGKAAQIRKAMAPMPGDREDEEETERYIRDKQERAKNWVFCADLV